jgi:tRNA pseudouridine(55) synthase
VDGNFKISGVPLGRQTFQVKAMGYEARILANVVITAGKEVVLKANTITIKDFKINGGRFPEIDFEIVCSKGTYIRSIASDFGQKLNSGGTLIALRRTKSGDFSIENALTVEACIEKIHAV